MTEKPWELPYSPWKTEAEFITWVRGVLRKGWSTHPIKLEYLKANKEKIPNPNPKTAKRFPTVNGHKCQVCGEWHLKVQVDHKSPTGGTFTKLSDIHDYAKYLYYISFDDLQLVCKSCHDVISYSQKMGISFEEAFIEKKIIAMLKKENLQNTLAILKENGYNDLSNDKKRRDALREYLKGEQND